MTVNFSDNYSRLNREIFPQIIADKFLTAALINYTCKCIRDLPEILIDIPAKSAIQCIRL